MNKILQHISHAREWLEKAEKKLRSDEAVEGELFLSLAEAEIHKAWENSMTSRQRKKPSLLETFKKYSVAKILMIIALICVLIFAGYSYYGSITDQPSLELSLPRERGGLEESISGNLLRGEVGLISNNLTLDH